MNQLNKKPTVYVPRKVRRIRARAFYKAAIRASHTDRPRLKRINKKLRVNSCQVMKQGLIKFPDPSDTKLSETTRQEHRILQLKKCPCIYCKGRIPSMKVLTRINVGKYTGEALRVMRTQQHKQSSKGTNEDTNTY